MWIRSQDRKKLTEIHDVTIYHDKQIWAGCSFVGEYSTEEKALMVLDWIQNQIEYKNVEVHQMPKDEGVEV
jgi:hypothetical protein|nr:MAG TPA: hypothetical protein [Caudoviricetes sp.]